MNIRLIAARNKAVLLLFVDSGVRRAEMVNLKPVGLELDNRLAQVLIYSSR